MVEKEIYVDPFLNQQERLEFIKDYKNIQKRRLETKMRISQNISRVSNLKDLSELSTQAFAKNKFMVMFRSFDCSGNIQEIARNLKGMYPTSRLKISVLCIWMITVNKKGQNW